MLKRKRNSYSLKTKLAVLEKVKNGESVARLGLQLGIPRTTIVDWKNSISDINQFCAKSNSEVDKRHTLKGPVFEKLDKAMFIWFTQERERGTPLSGPVIQEKARELNSKLGGDSNFSASNGWLNLWKKRHDIRHLAISGEKFSCDNHTSEMYKQELQDTISVLNLTHSQIYNCDETGLNFKMLPSTTLASKSEKSIPGFKENEDCLTIMACSNACGTNKLPLMVIAKSKKPRDLRNYTRLPVFYRRQKNGWMDCSLFKEWFHEQFVPAVEDFSKKECIPAKALLIIDNAPSHPKAPDLISGDIRVSFLPPNVTIAIQPMDQGILNCLKCNYRKKLLKYLITSDTENEPLMQKIKEVSMKEVIFWAAESWDMVQEHVIKNSWRKLLPEMENMCEQATNDMNEIRELVQRVPGCEQIEDSGICEWLSSDYDNVHEMLTEDEIVSLMLQDKSDQSLSQSDECNTEQANSSSVIKMEQADTSDVLPHAEVMIKMEQDSSSDILSHAEGLEALEKAFKYVSQQSEGIPENLIDYNRWRDYAASFLP